MPWTSHKKTPKKCVRVLLYVRVCVCVSRAWCPVAWQSFSRSLLGESGSCFRAEKPPFILLLLPCLLIASCPCVDPISHMCCGSPRHTHVHRERQNAAVRGRPHCRGRAEFRSKKGGINKMQLTPECAEVSSYRLPAHFMCLGVLNREQCTRVPHLLGFFKRGSCSCGSDSCTIM